MSPVRFASTPVLLGSGGSISKDPPCPMKLGTMRKVREMIEISLGRLRDVEKERLIAHIGEMVVSCALGVLPVVTIE